MIELIADTSFVMLLWVMWGLYHSRIYMTAKGVYREGRFPFRLPWWNEVHVVHAASVVIVALNLFRLGMPVLVIVGASMMGAGLFFNPLINVAYGRKWFAKPGRGWFPILGLKIPHGFIPHWAIALAGLALVVLSGLTQ
jgi:hypothetical protein